MISYNADKTHGSINIHWEFQKASTNSLSCLEQIKGYFELIQIYGDNVDLGKNALLFIGTWAESMCIFKQLQLPDKKTDNLTFIAGYITKGMWGRDPGEVEICLGILQGIMKPPFNSVKKEIPEIAISMEFMIENRCDRGSLPFKVSNKNLMKKSYD